MKNKTSMFIFKCFVNINFDSFLRVLLFCNNRTLKVIYKLGHIYINDNIMQQMNYLFATVYLYIDISTCIL